MNKIAIGSAQFGMSYGISNQLGITTKPQVEKILQFALNNDVNTIDTAALYGTSEKLIGDFTHDSCKKWDIVTKIPPIGNDINVSQRIDLLHKSFELSLDNLNRKNVYGLLLHSCDDLFLEDGYKLLQKMETYKRDGLVKKIGVSLYNENQIERLLDNFSIDLVQLPISILDQRLIESGHLKKLKKYDIEIHARSIFLQGLLLMEASEIPTWFDSIKVKINQLNKEARNQSISSLKLALSFVQSIDEIDKVIVGVNNLEQFQQVIYAKEYRVKIENFSSLAIADENFLNPTNWRI